LNPLDSTKERPVKPFLLVSDGFDKSLFAKLQQNSHFEVHPESKVSQEQLRELLPRVHGLVIRSATTVTPELLELASNLKLVIRAGEGTDNIDKKACRERGVKVANTPGANNNSAAEHAIALMLTTLRMTAEAHTSMSCGKWDKASFTGLELSNKTIGIVGFGRIGQIVAKRLSGFEPKVLFFDPTVEKSDLPYAQKANSLEELFAQSDIISLHTPLLPQTKNMVNDALLGSMKKTAILVNAARGGIVDEDALVKHLKARTFRAAGFDVFAIEPLPENSPLRECSNLIMTPHLGASTEEAQVRVGEMVLHQLEEFFVNNTLLNEVKA
jgi:D-3-phosphoglycerate dehydrogenase